MRLSHQSMLAVAVLVALLACGDEQVRTVRVRFAEWRGIVRGFACKETDSDRLLAVRAAVAGRISLVTDFIRLGGAPYCRSTQIIDWCEKNGCSVMFEHRQCIERQLVPGVSDVVRSLRGTIISDDAPQEWVVVRVVATAQPCSEVMASGMLTCSQLVGCAHSCPVDLTTLEGDVLLDLDVVNEHCEGMVRVCAAPSGPAIPEGPCL